MRIERVQIPAYTDRWMMGDRFGDLVKVVRCRSGQHKGREIAHVKMDISGKVVSMLLDDCRLVD